MSEVPGRRPLGSDDSDTAILCDPCTDEELVAEWYCMRCNDYLCDACAKAHRTNKASKHHFLSDRDKMPKQKYTPSKESMCSEHTGKLVEYYCKTHDELLCSDCATFEKHNKCDLESIDAISAEFEKSNEYTSLLDDIADLTEKLRSQKTISLKTKANVDHIYKTYDSAVKKFRSEINQSLGLLEKRTLLQAQTVCDKDTNSTKTVSTACESMISDLGVISSEMEKHKKYKQQLPLVISAKLARIKIDIYKKTIAEFNNQCPISDYTFQPKTTISKRLRKEESLGPRKLKTQKREAKH